MHTSRWHTFLLSNVRVKRRSSQDWRVDGCSIDKWAYQDRIRLNQNCMTVKRSHLGSRAAGMKTLGLLTAVWIGLALQPCAVAAVSDEGCSHCLTEANDYSPPVDVHCDSVEQRQLDDYTGPFPAFSNCCDLEEEIVNQRVDDIGSDLIPTIFPSSVPGSLIHPGPSEEPGNAADPPEFSGGSVPIHILKCVHLD